MGVTHKRAREVVTEYTGKTPKRGVKFPVGASLTDLLSVHLGCQVTEGAVL